MTTSTSDNLWPLDIDIPAIGQTLALNLRSAETTFFERPTSTELIVYTDEPDKGTVVGVSSSAKTLRFIPSIGPLPLLIFLKQRLLCPAGVTFRITLTVDFFIEIGVGEHTVFTHVSEIQPPKLSRAVYGPVDAAIICRAAHSTPYVTPQRAIDSFARETSDGEQTPYAQLRSPNPMLVSLLVSNTSDTVLEVNKVMVPTNTLGFYSTPEALMTSRLRLRLMNSVQAELKILGPPEAEAELLHDLNGDPIISTPRTTQFLPSYKSKTGLEFGF